MRSAPVGKSCGSGNTRESIFARGQNEDLRLVDRHDPKMPGQLSHYVVNWIVPRSCFRNNRRVKYRSEIRFIDKSLCKWFLSVCRAGSKIHVHVLDNKSLRVFLVSLLNKGESSMRFIQPLTQRCIALLTPLAHNYMLECMWFIAVTQALQLLSHTRFAI
jgi:hypothetical protein